VNRQGGTAADQNVFGEDLSKQQPAETDAWYAPSMYNVVKQDGNDVHLVIKPDKDCVVNSGLGSVRGARMAENRRSDVAGTQQQRLTQPMVWRYGTWQPTSWDDALDLVARVTARVIDKDNEDDLFVSMFDHGGSAGGYENTWGTGKLYFGSMKVKNCRIHNRPAYNSEVHSSRDMGVGELNYAYEDYGLTDTMFLIGANPLETQTNLFLNHMIPGRCARCLETLRRCIPMPGNEGLTCALCQRPGLRIGGLDFGFRDPGVFLYTDHQWSFPFQRQSYQLLQIGARILDDRIYFFPLA